MSLSLCGRCSRCRRGCRRTCNGGCRLERSTMRRTRLPRSLVASRQTAAHVPLQGREPQRQRQQRRLRRWWLRWRRRAGAGARGWRWVRSWRRRRWRGRRRVRSWRRRRSRTPRSRRCSGGCPGGTQPGGAGGWRPPGRTAPRGQPPAGGHHQDRADRLRIRQMSPLALHPGVPLVSPIPCSRTRSTWRPTTHLPSAQVQLLQPHQPRQEPQPAAGGRGGRRAWRACGCRGAGGGGRRPRRGGRRGCHCCCCCRCCSCSCRRGQAGGGPGRGAASGQAQVREARQGREHGQQRGREAACAEKARQ